MRTIGRLKMGKNGSFLIYPDVFGGRIRAFFTGIVPGVDREAVCGLLGVEDERLFMPDQRHTADIIAYSYSGRQTKMPAGADAVITRLDGFAIGVKTADCVPALFADEKTGAIGAVHAGWRGTAKGILTGAIGKMASLYGCLPGDLKLAIGPSIRGCCYEVGMDVLQEVRAGMGGTGHHPPLIPSPLGGDLTNDYFKINGGKAYLDLAAANRLQALQAGIKAENIWVSDMCTFCRPELFNSFRRESLKGQTVGLNAPAEGRGRQGGFIMRNPLPSGRGVPEKP